jgi:hypothetical protein
MMERGSAYNGGPGYPRVEASNVEQQLLRESQVNWDTFHP